MKHAMRHILISLIVIFSLAGCSKQPLQEINAAKAAVDAVISEGAEKYLPEDAKKINDALNKAMDEVKAQDSKMFKNYGKTKEMLAAVKSEADAVSAKLSAKKEEAKKSAATAIENAKTAISAAKANYDKASTPKGRKMDGEDISADLKNLDESFKELQMQAEREDYLTVAAKAGEISQKASALSAVLQQPPAKAEKKKK
jgi:hypothetical protein